MWHPKVKSIESYAYDLRLTVSVVEEVVNAKKKKE